MTTYLDRADWTKHGPVRPLEPMSATGVLGFAVHWPGASAPIGNPPASSIAARLEGYRQMHTAPGGLGVPDGGSDIAYQAAVDAAGRIWTLRGVGARPGANGDVVSNGEYGALLLMLGPGDHPSPEMIHAVRDWRYDVWFRYYPHADHIIGHRDVYSTTCPGDIAYRLVKDGVFAEGPSAYQLHRYLREGLSGSDVRACQLRIGLPGDGIFGPRTRESVILWQQGHHIHADGIVGPITARSFGWIWAP